MVVYVLKNRFGLIASLQELFLQLALRSEL